MPGFKLAPSTLSTRSAAAHRPGSPRPWAAPAAVSLLVLACTAPAQLDLGYDENALLAPDENATPVIVDPDTLQATIIAIGNEGVLCPPGSVGSAINSSGTTATVILSESIGGVQTAGCVLTFELDVPEGLALGMPTTILRGVSLGRTSLERRYSFEGAGATNAFIEEPAEDFVIVDRSDAIESASCGGNRRVSYQVDVTAQVLDADTFFQLDSVDLDTTFRTGTDWRFCDRDQKLVVAPGESGEFCDGPNARPCAEGLVCDREQDPNSDEGVCSEP
jgi:hypothetical protein